MYRSKSGFAGAAGRTGKPSFPLLISRYRIDASFYPKF